MISVALLAISLLALLPGMALAENYEGGQPLSTVQAGHVSGGVYVDATPPVFAYGDSLNQTKTFSLPADAVAQPGRIAWARLYVSVYCGHMQNNYITMASVSLDGNGDGVFETSLDPLLQSENVPFNFVVNGGNPAPSGGQPWAAVDDHTTRVSSDYLMWYDVAGLLSGAHPVVDVDTRGSFDGRIKVITLVVAYNDGDDDQIYYWVNQGHDVDSYYRDYPVYAPLSWNDYVGTTSFSGIPSGFAGATLTVNHMASSDGLYTLGGAGLTRYDSSGGNSSGQSSYSGFDVWDVTGYVDGSTEVLAYDRSALQGGEGDYSGEYYKIPLAVLAVRMPAGVPVARFSANVTSGFAPLCVQFADESTGPVSSRSWDFDGDGIADSTEPNPVHAYPSAGTYTVSLNVTGPGGSNSEVRAGYVRVTGTEPEADFSANRTTGYYPLCVAFTDLSAGIVTGWSWDFDGNGVADSNERNPVHTYAVAGTYTASLTVTGPGGSDSLAKTNYITVNAAPQFDLDLVRLNFPKNTVYAKENNTITVAVTNPGPDRSPATEVELQSSDGFAGRAAIPQLNAGQQAEVQIVDTIIRPLEGGTVTYTATVDPDNVLSETNEGNNAYSIGDCAVRYNGYKGKRYWEGGSDITTRRTYDLQGGLAYSQGNDIYHAGQWNNYTVTWTGSQPVVPAGATVVEAYLYVSWCWDELHLFPEKFNLTFNGQPVTWVNCYTDRANHNSVWGTYQYGLAPCNVTALYRPNSVNTLSVGRLDGKSSSIATFPFTLMVVYRDGNASRKQIFINEEYDLLAPYPDYGTTLDETIAYAPFSGMAIDMGNVSTATLYSFATHAGNPEGNLYFNNQTVAMGAYHGTTSTSGAEVYSVKNLLGSTGNEAEIQGTDGGSMGAIQQVLVAEYPHPVAGFTANATNGYPPLTVQFDSGASTGAITSYAWDFDNDGIVDSAVRDPVYTFITPGVYSVKLTVSGPGGSNSTVKPGFVSVLSSFNISLVPGWNLVSWPVDNGSLHASDLVNDVSLGAIFVTEYSASTQSFSSYFKGANPSKDFVMMPDNGYFVKVAEAGSFGVAGQPLPGHYVGVYRGWNLVGWSSFANVNASDVLADADFLILVSSHSPATGFNSYYRGANPSKNFLLTAGNGYFVKSTSASEQQLYIG